jgi:hypothetical protein
VSRLGQEVDTGLLTAYLSIRARYHGHATDFHSTGSYLESLAQEVAELRRLFGGTRRYWDTTAYRQCAKVEREWSPLNPQRRETDRVRQVAEATPPDLPLAPQALRARG